MQSLSAVEIANWTALYAATGACCMMAIILSVGFAAHQIYLEQPWRQAHGARAMALLLPQAWGRWQKLYLCSTPVTLGIVLFFGASLSWG